MAANFSFVNKGEFSSDGTGASFNMAAINLAAGDLCVVVVRWEEDSSASETVISSVTDTAGNTYTIGAAQWTGSTTEDQKVATAYCLNCLGDATNFVTVTISNARSWRRGIAMSYSYSNTIELGDEGNGSSGSDVSSWTTSPALSAVNGDLVLGVFGHYNTAPGNTPGSGYTERTTISLLLVEDKLPTGSFSEAPSAAPATGSDSYAAVTMVFQEVTGGDLATKSDSDSVAVGLSSVVSRFIEWNVATTLGLGLLDVGRGILLQVVGGDTVPIGVSAVGTASTAEPNPRIYSADLALSGNSYEASVAMSNNAASGVLDLSVNTKTGTFVI